MTATVPSQAPTAAAAQVRGPGTATGEVDAVVSGDAGHSGVRRLLLRGVGPGRLPPALQACLPGPTAGSSRLLKTHFKPGRRLTAHYQLTVAGDPAGSRCATVTWTMGGAADDVGQALCADRASELEQEAAARGVRGPFTRLTATQPQGQRHVTIFPLDPDFPQLVRLSDRRHLTQALSAAGLPAGHTQITVLRYHPRQRHVLRLTDPHGAGAPLYAKLYRTGRRLGAERLAGLGEHLQSAGSSVRLVAPAPELVDDAALVWRTAPGVPLSSLVLSGDLPSVVAAGAALRALHEIPAQAARDLPSYDLDRELRTVRSAATHLAWLCPELAALAAAVLAAVEERVRRLPGEPPTVLHGDVKTEHVLLGRQATWLDLDRCSVGDPALDLAKLLADLRWRLDADHPSRVVLAQDALLTGYGAPTGERRARARLLEPLFLVRFAARRVGLHERRWRPRVEALVTAAARLLDDVDRPIR